MCVCVCVYYDIKYISYSEVMVKKGGQHCLRFCTSHTPYHDKRIPAPSLCPHGSFVRCPPLQLPCLRLSHPSKLISNAPSPVAFPLLPGFLWLLQHSVSPLLLQQLSTCCLSHICPHVGSSSAPAHRRARARLMTITGMSLLLVSVIMCWSQ